MIFNSLEPNQILLRFIELYNTSRRKKYPVDVMLPRIKKALATLEELRQAAENHLDEAIRVVNHVQASLRVADTRSKDRKVSQTWRSFLSVDADFLWLDSFICQLKRPRNIT